MASQAKGIQPRSLELVDDLEAVHYIMDTGVVDLPVRFIPQKAGVRTSRLLPFQSAPNLRHPIVIRVWIAQFDVVKAFMHASIDDIESILNYLNFIYGENFGKD